MKTNRTLNEIISIGITDLLRAGCINSSKDGVAGVVTWKLQGAEIGRAYLGCNISEEKFCLWYYDTAGKEIKQFLKIIQDPGNGRVYFTCPQTGRNVSRLYYARGRFRSRYTFNTRRPSLIIGLEDTARPDIIISLDGAV